ncbi:hypothetical protein B0H11DRAFT_1965818, partial [Mycena galericulata]
LLSVLSSLKIAVRKSTAVILLAGSAGLCVLWASFQRVCVRSLNATGYHWSEARPDYHPLGTRGCRQFNHLARNAGLSNRPSPPSTRPHPPARKDG